MKNVFFQHAARLDERLTRRLRPLGAALALLLSALLALYNVSSGPLGNLNDIGGWANRSLFIGMTAALQGGVLLAATWMHRGRFSRLLLRQLALTFALLLMLMGINQKTYAYVQQVQPIVRAMDEGGLAAAFGFETPLSAPALTLLYAVTRGPVYDMYLVKLLCIGCMLGLALLAAHAADGIGAGMRAEAVLCLCLILPQGFLSAACAAQTDVAAALLLGLSLTLLCGKKRLPAAWLLFGVAAALSGAALYALPVYACSLCRRESRPLYAAGAAATALLLCVPAMACGMPVGAALTSLLRANFSLPPYAAGAPNLMGLFPRAAMEEMPEYFMLRQVPALDPVTHATEYYTQGHFTVLLRGITLAGLALYIGLCALVRSRRDRSAIRQAFVLALGALIVCPGVSMGAWLFLDVLCILAVVLAPALRLPACLVLFATAAGCCYPVTEEILLPTAAGFALCAVALCMLLDIVPGAAGKKEGDRG